jgi:hypothetical protein
MKPTSRLLWAAVNTNMSIVIWHDSPVLCATKREAELKSPIGKAVKVLVTIHPT